MDEIIAYLMEKYAPTGMIVYGSYANGTNNLNSDFDALLITRSGDIQHDTGTVLGTRLDVFLYPESCFAQAYDMDDFVQIWDGRIIRDETGLAQRLKDEVAAHIQQQPRKTDAENADSLAWCEKMLERTRRDDMEGLYRLHWLLVDSLEIYFDLKGLYYWGPKKALRQMKEEDPYSAELYGRALREPNDANLSAWLRRLKEL